MQPAITELLCSVFPAFAQTEKTTEHWNFHYAGSWGVVFFVASILIWSVRKLYYLDKEEEQNQVAIPAAGLNKNAAPMPDPDESVSNPEHPPQNLIPMFVPNQFEGHVEPDFTLPNVVPAPEPPLAVTRAPQRSKSARVAQNES